MQDNPLSDIRLGQVTKKWAENNHLYTHYSASVESTNDLAKSLAFDEKLLEEPLCLFLADHQTAGRGRGKNTWVTANPGSALLSSWSYLLGAKPQPTTSCLVGLAVYRALSTTWPFLPWNIKAPNDIYIGKKKVAGILMESILQGDEVRIIVGLGVNVLSSPADLAIAGSILEALPAGVPLLGQDWTACLDRLMFEMTDAISHCEDSLSPSDQHSLLMALNAHPLLKSKYTGLEANGTLLVGNEKINWWEL
ncbi:biotin--[acetyl-CoA-carboxylase] ligase [Bdellovibrio sp. HCB337]|uniref:biotin--[acetyl-CoA-carboxylase] ligase n=1 Tax=Bdellovibrio sp. HCB337 TaxID=3394358 RepID=UPI0039A6E35A